MACQSPDVVTATQKSLTAKEQIDKLQKAIKDQSEQTKNNFF